MPTPRDDPHALAEIPVIDAPDGPLQLARMQATPPRPHRRPYPPDHPRPRCSASATLYAARCLRSARNPVSARNRRGRAPARPARRLRAEFQLRDGLHHGLPINRRQRVPRSIARSTGRFDWVGTSSSRATRRRPGHMTTSPGPAIWACSPRWRRASFAAAINQPPMTYSFDRISLGLPIDWVVNRWRVRKADRTAAGAPAAPGLRAMRDLRSREDDAGNHAGLHPGDLYADRHDARLPAASSSGANMMQSCTRHRSASPITGSPPGSKAGRVPATAMRRLIGDAGCVAIAGPQTIRLAAAAGAEPPYPHGRGVERWNRRTGVAGLAWGRAADPDSRTE